VTAVLDASAVLALLFGEPGADTVVDHIAAGAAISTVNIAEVATVLVRNGRNPNSVLDPLRSQVDVVAFTDADAITTAELYPLVSTRGLSLGDRACLALARRLDATAVTAEHLWAELDLTIRIDTIRARQRDDAG
jgi:ribonuclease VapC